MSVKNEVLLSELLECIDVDPFGIWVDLYGETGYPFRNKGYPVSVEEVEFCYRHTIESFPEPYIHDYGNRKRRFEHINRVAYHVKHRTSTPIDFDAGSTVLVCDGWHRLCAHIINKSETVAINWRGFEENMHRWFSKSIELGVFSLEESESKPHIRVKDLKDYSFDWENNVLARW